MTTKTKSRQSTRSPALPKMLIISALVVVIATISLAIAVLLVRQAKSGPPMGTVTINDQTFRVEIADTESKQQTGLMFRKELPEKNGMLFVFDRLSNIPFWMRNTYLPLDIIFIAEDRKIINIVSMPPLTDEKAFPDRPYRYVLELVSGSAQRYSLQSGQAVDIQLPR